MANSGSIIFRDDIESDFYSLQNISESLYSETVSVFSDSNILYNMSSVMEDIVLNKYLSMHNTASSINVVNMLRSNIVIESFTSNDYYDLEFPVDNQLNLDLQNGDLTLPIMTTKTLPVSDIILSSECNGKFGNSFDGGKNADISVILNSNNTGMVEYELVSNSWRSPTLVFGATLKLEEESICNGVYIRTYTEEGTQYPKVESVKISADGEVWTEIPSTISINKADYYIRFTSQSARFIKVVLTQSTYYPVQTTFGNKNRYLIGIREISVKQSTYKAEGEYVSKVFSTGETINSIVFKSKEESNNDISYFVSADNGSGWVKIKDGQHMQLSNTDMGLRGDIDISAIRIKVLMNRSLLPNTNLKREWITTNNSNKYFLTNTPVNTDSFKAWIGGHITCGDNQVYEIRVDDTSTVDKEILATAKCVIDKRVNFASTLKFVPYYDGIENDLIVKMNGLALKNDRNTYNIIKHSNPLYSIIIFNQEAFLSGSIPESQISIHFAQHLHDNRGEKTQIITLPESKPAFVPSKDGISVTAIKYSDINVTSPTHLNLFDSKADTFSVLEGKTDIDGVNCWLIGTGDIGEPVCPKQYTFTPHLDTGGAEYDYNPSKWTFEGSLNGTSWVTIDDVSMVDGWTGKLQSFKIDNDCYFRYFRWRVTANSSDTNVTTLNLAGINIYEGELERLDSASFEVIDRNTIEIKKESYSISWDYLVDYAPAVSIQNYLPEEITNNIEVQGLPAAPRNSKLCFEYEYQDTNSNDGKVYYTPICNEYRIELL